MSRAMEALRNLARYRNLTRDEAHDVVSAALDEDISAGTLDALLDVQEAWFGHRHVFKGETPETLADVLDDYVDERAFAGDGERNDGPRGSDPTDLCNPWEDNG